MNKKQQTQQKMIAARFGKSEKKKREKRKKQTYSTIQRLFHQFNTDDPRCPMTQEWFGTSLSPAGRD